MYLQPIRFHLGLQAASAARVSLTRFLSSFHHTVPEFQDMVEKEVKENGEVLLMEKTSC